MIGCSPDRPLLRVTTRIGLLALLLSGAVAASPRDQYRDALKALARGESGTFERLRGGLNDYPLAPYLEIAGTAKALDRADPGTVRSLLDNYPALPPTWRLRRSWLRRLAKEERWSEFLADYTDQRDMTLRCQRARAELAVRGDVAYEASLWLVGKSQPDACDPVFSHWRSKGLLGEDPTFDRAVLAARAGEASLASYLARGLDSGHRDLVNRWLALRTNPAQGLVQARTWRDSEDHRSLLVNNLKRLAPGNNELARAHWPDLKAQFAFSSGQAAGVDRELALFYATDYPIDALPQLAALPPSVQDQQILEWQVRVAVHAGDWPAVAAAVARMPASHAGRDRWQYWLGRAREKQGDRVAAESIYRRLADKANYFGFLAADRLGTRYALCPEVARPDSDTFARLLSRPAMQRALELAALNEWRDARSEWNTATAGLSREQRRQAAVLADSYGWFDRSILTLADSGHQTTYHLRFPLAWHGDVSALASRFALNPSLIYGVMRSESALVVDAVSGAGARGLMQVTPATARDIARKIGEKAPTARGLIEQQLSLRFGSAYLRQLFDRYEHPLKVMAAYNAGPDALERWDALNLPAEPDRWIESLPFYETRDYLMRVLAFSALYDWRREGKMVPMAVRMPTLTDRPGVTDFGVRGRVVPHCPS